MDSKVKIAIFSALSISLIGDGGMGINPVIQKIAEYYPNISFENVLFVATLPMLTCMLASFFIGFVVGKKIGFKPVLLGGVLSILVSGIVPFLFELTFTMLLVSRAVFGVGLGLLVSNNAYIVNMFEGELRTRVLGWSIAVMNVGTIFLQMISGILGDISWQYACLVYLIAVIPLGFGIIYLKEPELSSEEKNEMKQKIEIKPVVWLYVVFSLVSTVLLYPLVALMSTFLEETNIGGAAVSGTILSLYTVGGVIGGVLYAWMCKVSKKYIVTLLCVLMAGGQALVLYGNNIVLIGIGTLFCGIGLYSSLALLIDFNGMVSNKSALNLTSNLIYVGCYAGCFMATYWMAFISNVFGDMIISSFLAAVIGFAIIGLIFVIKDPRPKSEENFGSTEEFEY